MEQPRVRIDPLSARSLLLETAVNNLALMTATGFVVTHGDSSFLVTNWHVVSGRNPDDEKPLLANAAIPDSVRVVHHVKDQLGSWKIESEPLYRADGTPRWIEHPRGRTIDVVALPVTIVPSDVQIYPFDLGLADADLMPQPAMPVSIIGFPFGLSAGGAWPIWKTGHIATDPDLDYDGRPSFLIDATTRNGMSGSPVVVRSSGGYMSKSGNYILSGGIVTKFLGVYSGRIHGDAEIGRVWRPQVVQEILARI